VSAQATLIEVAPRAGNPDTDQRFTTQPTLIWCKRTAIVTRYDLDAAACSESAHAPVWYSKAENGVELPWFGDAFVNPPWSEIYPWVSKAWAEWSAEAALIRAAHHLKPLTSVSMLLPGDRQHMEWWQDLVEPYRDDRGAPAGAEGVRLTTHYPPKPRPHYGHPGNPRGVGCVEPNFTSALLVFRRSPGASSLAQSLR
jgi:hypothetical protein